ncbi:phosphopyruvate hydratase [Candidatus Dependentiae bacterium]|nr:phosphopyruvate hydratase [Candidatus Dependentiae bacterium]
MKITRISGREVYDSRGWPTVQCELFLENGDSVLSYVPSGVSTGIYEALELRDGGKRLMGKGVLKAIENIETLIAPVLVGHEPHGMEMDLKLLELDGTTDKSRLGANALLAVSMAIFKAEAHSEKLELYELIAYYMGSDSVSLPFPMLNVINGGMHAYNKLRIQEFMIIPVGAPTFRSAFEAATLVYHELKALLIKKNKSTAVGDEGGFAAAFESDAEALDVLLEAIEAASAHSSVGCIIGLDVAASQYYNSTTQLYSWQNQQLTSDEMIDYYKKLVDTYPIYSIEDGLSEEDWSGWIRMTKALENKIQIVGDDLFVTNPYRIAQGGIDHAATSVIIKPNQIGTITETLQAIKLCKDTNLATIVSHRSGETEDTFIADLAVGASVGQIKAGACRGSERLAKYNRLLTIEDTLAFSLLDT